MKYPLSELVDRYSILELKVERLPENKEISAEHKRFGAAIKEFGIPSDDYVRAMKEINGRIWDLEFQMRMSDTLPLDEIGRRAIKIRNINKERIAFKNKIAKAHGEFEEVKVDHASS